MTREGTKQATLIGLLRRPKGASIREMVEGTGWQKNTVHSTLATLRKRGFDIAVADAAPEKRYQITVGPESETAKQ